MPGTTHDFLYPTNCLEDDSGNNYECIYIRGAFTRRAAQADNIIYAQKATSVCAVLNHSASSTPSNAYTVDPTITS